jgi:hypothetical protein
MTRNHRAEGQNSHTVALLGAATATATVFTAGMGAARWLTAPPKRKLAAHYR